MKEKEEVKIDAKSSDSAVGFDVHIPSSFHSTPQSASVATSLASFPRVSGLPTSLFWSSFGLCSPPPSLQCTSVRSVESSLFSALSSRLSSGHSVLSFSLSKSSRAWVRSIPTPSSFLTDREFSLASRLRLGLPLFSSTFGGSHSFLVLRAPETSRNCSS